jgi:hypothetical protein
VRIGKIRLQAATLKERQLPEKPAGYPFSVNIVIILPIWMTFEAV